MTDYYVYSNKYSLPAIYLISNASMYNQNNKAFSMVM